VKDIILIGGGGHCKSVIDVIEQEGKFQIVGIVDKSELLGTNVLGYQIISNDSDLGDLSKKYKYALVTVGQIKSPSLRIKLFDLAKTAGFILPSIISPNAYVSQHASIGNGYVWITSWAGGLRRYKISDGSWERVPVPEDDQLTLITCADSSYELVDGRNILKNYYMNPRDPIDGGNHNHKAFSVLSYNDTIWVGTANGINRGIFGSQGCIDWQHYAYPFENLAGNFVVSIARQYWNGQRIIWAATMNADDPTEQRGVSYTLNDGDTWYTALEGERVYNVHAQDSLVFAASAKGLWKSKDGQNWALFKPAKNVTPLQGDETISSEVYSVVLDERAYYNGPVLWIGTGDGVARSADLDGSNWEIYRASYT